jgi:hypothetical protein
MVLHETGTILAFIVPVRGVDFECRPLDSQEPKCFPSMGATLSGFFRSVGLL